LRWWSILLRVQLYALVQLDDLLAALKRCEDLLCSLVCLAVQTLLVGIVVFLLNLSPALVDLALKLAEICLLGLDL